MIILDWYGHYELTLKCNGIVQTVTLLELYEAFKERLLAEQAEEAAEK